jgi:hypothetical protein
MQLHLLPNWSMKLMTMLSMQYYFGGAMTMAILLTPLLMH